MLLTNVFLKDNSIKRYLTAFAINPFLNKKNKPFLTGNNMKFCKQAPIHFHHLFSECTNTPTVLTNYK